MINEYWGQSDPDLRVGDEVVLQIAGRPTIWRVVGLIGGVPNRIPPTPSAYLPYRSLAEANGEPGLATTVKVRATPQDQAGRAQVAEALEGRFKAAGLRTFRTFTADQWDSILATVSSIIVLALLLTAGLLGLVGGLGLMGTMGLNVLERAREIGVLRAIGARTGAVMRSVVTEGVLIGGLSWLLGALLAFPLSQLLCAAVGRAFIGSALQASLSLGGMALVLLAAVGLASLASWLPARSAARVTVRAALAYE